jgi:hypothetical protein
MRVKERTSPAKFNLDLSTENDCNMMPPFPLLYPNLMHQNNAGEQSSPLGVRWSTMGFWGAIFSSDGSHGIVQKKLGLGLGLVAQENH